MTTEFDLGNFYSVIHAKITPRGFVSEDANVAHINKYVQSFEDLYNVRSGAGMVICKMGSFWLLDNGMLMKSEDYLLCRACVIKQREKERKADESVMRKIINDIITKKLSKLELQKN